MGTAFLCHPCRAPTLGKVTWRWCSRREEKGTNLPAPPWGRDETFVAAEILLSNLSLLPPRSILSEEEQLALSLFLINPIRLHCRGGTCQLSRPAQGEGPDLHQPWALEIGRGDPSGDPCPGQPSTRAAFV